jgi:hypothetical protein
MTTACESFLELTARNGADAGEIADGLVQLMSSDSQALPDAVRWLQPRLQAAERARDLEARMCGASGPVRPHNRPGLSCDWCGELASLTETVEDITSCLDEDACMTRGARRTINETPAFLELMLAGAEQADIARDAIAGVLALVAEHGERAAKAASRSTPLALSAAQARSAPQAQPRPGGTIAHLISGSPDNRSHMLGRHRAGLLGSDRSHTQGARWARVNPASSVPDQDADATGSPIVTAANSATAPPAKRARRRR